MRKFFGLLLLLSLTQVGIAYAGTDAANTPVANRDYIFGVSKSSTVNLNQVLFLLAGKDGKNGRDGIDGIAGRDGINGINGVNGTNGINGTNGVDGKDGLNGKDGKDGRDGAQGPAGPQGPAGTPGSGSSGSISDLRYGAAPVLTGACTETATVGLKALFTGEDFVFDYATFKEVNTRCGDGGHRVGFYLKINSGSGVPSPKVAGAYTSGDVIVCGFDIPNSSTWGTGSDVQFRLDGDLAACNNITHPVASNFRLKDISTADYYRAIGFEFYRG